jgi:hypothetical protein
MSNIDLSREKIIFCGNDEEYFDSVITEKLGSYVYALTDPRDKKVFYIGKAGGKEGQGNNRIFSHFEEASNAIKNNIKELDQKTRRIIEIWSADERVEWYIVRHGLPDEMTALHIEAALIDAFSVSQNGPALNLVRGHGTASHGILTPDMVREFGAKPVAPTNACSAVFIFPVQNAVARGESIYEATRKAWAVSKDLRETSGSVAVGVANGIAKGVFDVESWHEYRPNQSVVGSVLSASQSGKTRNVQLYEFDGVPMETSEFIGCDFSAVISSAMGFWQRGNYLVVEIVNDKGKMCFRFLRGGRDKASLLGF